MALGLTLSQVRDMSSAEKSAWIAYNRVEPIGELRADIRTAQVLQQTAEMHRDRKRRSEPYKLEDFLPFRQKPEKPPEDARSMGERLKAMFNPKG